MLDSTDVMTWERLAPSLAELGEPALIAAVNDGSLLTHAQLGIGIEGKLGTFYAPFDWINERADIVLVGITPGKQQAEAALLALRRELQAGASLDDAAGRAKQEASFKGDMREIAALLMDHFALHRLFGLASCSMLFGEASARVHYTSVFRYPVLELSQSGWKNHAGAGWSRSQLLREMVEQHLVAELRALQEAWLVPFGPVPHEVLMQLGRRGLIEDARVLGGLNHPTGQQWNRHNCQLGRVDHARCAANVGCSTIQSRSAALRQRVSSALART